MGKTKRGSQYEYGYFKEKRYTWICVECGREWQYQNYANRCDHENQMAFYSEDHIAKCLNINDYPKEILTDQDGKVSYR